MRVLVLLGPPGAGKGTQARLLAEALGLVQLATGDLFRAALRDGTPLGVAAGAYMERGELVPDDVTTAMLLERFEAPDIATGGAILDGFPRTRAQAEALDLALADRDADVIALALVVPADRLVERLAGRTICEAAGHVYNSTAHRPRVAGICDEDGSPLVQRDDDRPATVRARLTAQMGALDDVIDYYTGRGILGSVDGDRDVQSIATDLAAEARRRFGRAA